LLQSFEGCCAMISSNLPFAKLRALLLDLGFVEGVVEGK
jgi:hypothetical protein